MSDVAHKVFYVAFRARNPLDALLSGHIHIFCAHVDPFVEQLDPRAYDAGSD